MGNDIIATARNGIVQTRRSRGQHSWHDPVRQEKFLIHLAATANISRSAKAAGLNPVGGYTYRRQNPVFRAAWDQALAEGVTRMRALLIEAGEAQAAVPRGADGEIDRIALAAFNPGLAMALVKMHGPTVDGEATGRGRPVPRSADELRAAILLRIEAIGLFRGDDDAEPGVARPDAATNAASNAPPYPQEIAVQGDRDDDA